MTKILENFPPDVRAAIDITILQKELERFREAPADEKPTVNAFRILILRRKMVEQYEEAGVTTMWNALPNPQSDIDYVKACEVRVAEQRRAGTSDPETFFVGQLLGQLTNLQLLPEIAGDAPAIGKGRS